MTALRKYLRLPRAERALVRRAFMLTAAARAGLTLFKFPRLKRWFSGTPAPGIGSPPIERIAWSIRIASRYIPRSTCLVQALAARPLMARYGYHCELRIGVNRDHKGTFGAHAWLEYNGHPVIGEWDSADFTPLPPIA